jgi:hypothetical protein
MSRTTALTPDAHTAIVRAVKTGVTRKAAAFIGGISDRTLRTWVERGATGEEPFASFADDLAEAESEVEQAMTATVLHCAIKKKDWRAAQAWLEKRVPEWRPGPANGQDGSDTKPTEVYITVSGPKGDDNE